MKYDKIIKQGEEFQNHWFWRHVMLPYLQNQIEIGKESLLSCDAEDIETIRADVLSCQKLMELPKLLIDAATDDKLVEIEIQKNEPPSTGEPAAAVGNNG